MTFQDELREILNGLATAYRKYPLKQIEETTEVNTAISAITALVKKRMPEKMIKIGEECFGCLNGSKCKYCGVYYFNSACAEMRRKIDE